MTAFITAGQEPIAPASPAPFDAERIGLARHVARLEIEIRHVGGARHRVVHEARGQQLAGGLVVDGVLHQRLADALHHAAMHLAREQQRIERGAEIVDDDVA